MKTSTLISKIMTTVLSGLTMLGLTTAALAWMPVAVASAATPNALIVPITGLEEIYANTLTIFQGQETRFSSVALQIADDAQKFIDIQRALGRDTSSLDAALANFNAQIAEASTAHDQAGSILSAHAGFTANGRVANRAQAVQTLNSARDYMRQAHNLIASSGRDLNAALRAFHQANDAPALAASQP